MHSAKSITCALALLAILALPIVLVPHAASAPPVIGTYTLSAVPAVAQEGSTITLALTVSGFTGSTSLKFQFRFNVRDPSGLTTQSTVQNHTTAPNENEFTILVNYPSGQFPGTNSLTGQYDASVDELMPIAQTQVATTTFMLSITDSLSYERTVTVNMRVTGYNASEAVTIIIRTVATSTLVFSQTLPASSNGIVLASWQVPKNATIDSYQLTITGTSTNKNPVDAQRFSVRAATMTIPSITSWKLVYQRTETLRFTFQPKYPDGTFATTGIALMTLTRPDRANMTIPATYDTSTQLFTMTYQTSTNN